MNINLALVATLVVSSWVAVSAQPTLIGVLPGANALAHGPSDPLVCTFSEPMDPATFTGTSLQIFGRWSGVHAFTATFSQGGTVATLTPSEAFAAGEQVTLSLGPTVASAVGVALGQTSTHHFWIGTLPSDFQFTQTAVYNVRQTGEGSITAYGAYAGDLNRDGFPDLSIPNETSNDVRVFMNDGTGSFPTGFSIHPLPGGSVPSSNEGADFNGDGWIDFVTAHIGGDAVGVFMNDGAGAYLPAVVYPMGDGPRGVAVLDVDRDGDADIICANRNGSTLSLRLNAGDGTFQAVQTLQAGVSGETSLATGDANGDGITDLFVGGYTSQNIALLLGNGSGGFTVSSVVGAGGRPWMLASGDVDGDGFLDVAACLSNTGGACVVRSNGQGGLLPAQLWAGGNFTLAIDLGDLDGDGDLDMVSSNYGSGTFSVHQNLGGGQFATPVVLPAVQAGSCAIMVDLDGDQRQELVGIDELADRIFVWALTPKAVQLATFGAALEVNGSAVSAGFGGLAPAPLPLSSTAVFNILGTAHAPYALFAGAAQEPGVPTQAGTINLDLGTPPLALLDGFNGPCPCTLDATGQALQSLTVPASLPLQLQLTVQCLVGNPGNRALGVTASNPITVVTVP